MYFILKDQGQLFSLWYNPFKENRFKDDISYFTFSMYQLKGDLRQLWRNGIKNQRELENHLQPFSKTPVQLCPPS